MTGFSGRTNRFTTLYIAFILMLSTLSISSFAQEMLMFKKNKRRQAYYKAGDIISFRIKGERRKITDVIRDFEDSVIVFRDYRLNPSQITHLYVDKQTVVWYIFRYKYERLFLFAGGGYLLLDVLNTGELSGETAVIGGSLICAGVLARFLISDAIKIRGRKKLYILDL
jgi:hypothetical protein